MISYEDYEQKVVEWVAEWAKKPGRLSPGRCINGGIFTGGLGVAGNDGDDLIGFLHERSGVDFSDFDFDRYFGHETLSWIFQPSRWRALLSSKKLTIRDLAAYMYPRQTPVA